MADNTDTYDEVFGIDENSKRLFPRAFWNYVQGCNSLTTKTHQASWDYNIRKNAKKLLRKNGVVHRDILGLAADKAVIAVGSGPSLSKNQDVLQKAFLLNITYDVKEQPFLIVSSNHQFKPLLRAGIVPHFVMISDPSDAIYDQLNTDIPPEGDMTILIAPIQASHKVLRGWDRAGRYIVFYVQDTATAKEEYTALTGRNDFSLMRLYAAGNVMNAIWTAATQAMHSKIHMCIGNDLSFPYSKNVDERRQSYYADGEYEINIKNDRDEAKDRFAWMGFEFPQRSIITLSVMQDSVNMKVVGTSRTLFTYKLWPEVTITRFATQHPLHYYNCSEAGILGMIPKSYDKGKLDDPDNWELLDNINPRWHTRRFEDAVSEYLKVREICQGRVVTRVGAERVVVLPGKTGIVSGTDQNFPSLTVHGSL